MGDIKIVKSDMVQDVRIASIKMSNVKGGNIELWACNGGVVIMSNVGQTEVTLEAGHFVCGFGKITWKSLEADQDPDHPELLVSFESGADKVVVNTSLVTLQQAVDHRRQDHANVSIHYHVIQPSSEPGSFKLSRQRKVVAVLCRDGGAQLYEAEGEQGEGKNKFKGVQNNLAASLPLGNWAKCGVASIVWKMNWIATGLIPVRPQVVWGQTHPPNALL